MSRTARARQVIERVPRCTCDREHGDSDCPLHSPFPCPFCGNDETVEYKHKAGEVWVECGDCEARGPVEPDTDAAVWAWNCARSRDPKAAPAKPGPTGDE